ncbi:sulfatase domain protein [Seiridium cupressi]
MTSEYHKRLSVPLDGRNLVFSTITTSIISAKAFRIYSHSDATSSFEIAIWGVSFFSEDLIFLLGLRYLLSKTWCPSQRIRYAASAIAGFAATALLLMAAATISVFLITGSEIHWHHIGVMNDSSGSKMMFSAGFNTFVMVLATLVSASWFSRRICYDAAGAAIDMATEAFALTLSFVKSRSGATDEKSITLEEGGYLRDRSGSRFDPAVILRVAIGFAIMLQIPMAFIHSDDPRLNSLSWTLPLMPCMEPSHSSAQLYDLSLSRGDSGSNSTHGAEFLNVTALREPIRLPWLPQNVRVPGFEDWYDKDSQHYASLADPLKVFNLDERLHPALRKSIADINVRHVVFLILESTRSDVFPIENATSIWNRLAESYSNKTLPQEEIERLTNLTNTARLLAGVDNDHLDQSKGSGGGIRARNAFTTASYTLKSLVGTLCGITPLTVDFDEEVSHHIYQPCLGHIFQAFNSLNNKDLIGKSFTSHQWKSLFMQSVTGEYDKQSNLMYKMGYDNDSLITKEYLKGAQAKFGPEDTPDINYYGMPEVVLEEYIRDAFSIAAQNNERLFLTHLTSTSHHPFKIPASTEESAGASDKKSVDDLTGYLNAIGYVDRWIGKVRSIIDEAGVTDETLLVVLGDHGISLPEDDAITPYENPNVGNFRVPIMLHHPKLPKMDIQDAVISSQVLPTVLDLLLESKSLSRAESRAARDLVGNYEGQSLLRPLKKVSQSGGGDWHFSVSNPGGTMVSVRDAREPRWRLIVPLSSDVAWRFTDLETDRYEKSPLTARNLLKLAATIRESYGAERAEWIEEAASVTRWWVQENRRRWRYNP